jgi:ligand-binding SRPBCC domain-containing protein
MRAVGRPDSAGQLNHVGIARVERRVVQGQSSSITRVESAGGAAGGVSIARAGRTWLLTTSTVLERSREQVFPFFADARNLELITPPLLRFELLTPNIEMRAGALIDYRLRVHGLPLRWRTRIAAWDPPHRFVDEQLRGPYHLWCHEHVFDALAGGRTRMTDRIVYRPLGGKLAHRLVVERDLRAVFDHRLREIRRLLEP